VLRKSWIQGYGMNLSSKHPSKLTSNIFLSCWPTTSQY